MNNTSFVFSTQRWLLILLAVFAVGISGCSKKKDIRPEDSGNDSGEVSETDLSSGRADSDSDNAMGLHTIFFPYDSFEIVGEGKEDLAHNAEIMKANSSLKVQVEGHCDERGGIQYNLALGEKRANAIKQALQRMGISKGRVSIISMGKEKPLVSGSNEEAWAKNRRGNFVITQK